MAGAVVTEARTRHGDTFVMKADVIATCSRGRRTLPGSLFRRDDVAELGSEGSVDVFDLTRRLGHRMGLAAVRLRASRSTSHSSTYQVPPGWPTYPRPVPAQIGGVARAAGPCPIDYRIR
jgi:hypothetical protein